MFSQCSRIARRLALEQGVTLDVYTYHFASRRGEQVTLQRVAEMEGPQSPAFQCREPISVSPAAIINATGAWVDRTLAQLQIPGPQLLGGTKGSHLLTSNPQLREALSGHGVYAEAGDGRPVFLLPFGPFSLVGTTDLPFQHEPETAVADRDELQYLLRAVGEVFPPIQLTGDDIVLHYSGVRPLPHTSPTSPASITRRHLLYEHTGSGLPIVSIIGGKLTTCRSLAEETAQLVLGKLALKAHANSRDRTIPGGESYPASEQQQTEYQTRLANRLHLTYAQVCAVWQLCGTRTESLLAPTSSDPPDSDGLANLTGTDLPLRFVQRVIRDEWCCRLTDLIERRLMLLYAPQLSVDALRHLAQLMVAEGLLSQASVDVEVEQCVDRLRSHFGRTI